MSEMLNKFPSTPHLAWLADTPLREDKAMSEEEAQAFLSGPVVVEEKIDGANLGLSFSASGELRFQNRGNWLEGKLTGQWNALRGWAAKHEAQLRRLLPAGNVVFGEWCYAVHSIAYDRLPDWFVAFDVYDGRLRRFWSTNRRHALMKAAGLAEVPKISDGTFSLRKLEHFLRAVSAFGDAPREGLYLRREDDEWLLERAKLVRACFTQSIGEHWSTRRLTRNVVASQT